MFQVLILILGINTTLLHSLILFNFISLSLIALNHIRINYIIIRASICSYILRRQKYQDKNLDLTRFLSAYCHLRTIESYRSWTFRTKQYDSQAPQHFLKGLQVFLRSSPISNSCYILNILRYLIKWRNWFFCVFQSHYWHWLTLLQ